MKKSFVLFTSAVLVVLGVAVSGPALAHGRVHFGVFIGGSVFPGYYAPYYPPVYYPPVYVTPPSPPVYIERQAAPTPAQPQGDWFYCEDSKTYYPYVKECPGGWQRVSPQPPPPPH